MQIYALMPNLSSPCWARLVSMGKSVCRPRHRCGKLHCPCTAQPPHSRAVPFVPHQNRPSRELSSTQGWHAQAASRKARHMRLAETAAIDLRGACARHRDKPGALAAPSPLAGSTPACLREPFPPYAAGGAGWELDCSWIATVCAVRLVTAPPDRSLPRAQGQVGHTASSTA